MKKEEIKKIIKQDVQPSPEYILEMARSQFDYVIGGDMHVTTENYMKHYDALTSEYAFSMREFLRYKSEMILDLVETFGYDVARAESEFGYFMTHYGLKVIGDEETV